MLHFRGLLSALLLGGLAAIPATFEGQTVTPDAGGRVVFKTNARAVVLDVVVTESGQPVAGLHREDFKVFEDGHPQTITSFEEHVGARSIQTSLPDLPVNVFTNVPRVTPTDSVTVLLLDSLNTELEDQSRVQAQTLKFLRSMESGRRIAILTLGSRLQLIQGFTADPALLAAALSNPKNGSGPKSSNLLRSEGDRTAENQSSAQLADTARSSAATLAALSALREFQAKQRVARTNQRVEMTLDALQQLGRYLADIPGRKNVVWFSGGFPLTFAGDSNLNDAFGLGREYDQDVRKTSDLLTGAEVAIYPVDASGLWAPNGGISGARPGTNALLNSSLLRNSSHSAMEEIARDTGGEAIYNTNGLSEALARVIEHGTHFYTLAYTPANSATDGRYRKLHVKMVSGNYALAYRRGYYAIDAKALNTARSAGDPLRRYMGPGMPDSTQIPIALRVQRVPPAAGAAAGPASYAGENDKLRLAKGTLTRYTVDFVIAASGLKLDFAPNGGRLGRVEATMVIFDQDGTAQNWVAKQVDLTMTQARFAEVQANGVNFRLQIDAPASGVSLRGGVFDLGSGFAGTLEIPLSSVLLSQAVRSPQTK